MERVETIAQLLQIKETYLQRSAQYKYQVLVCGGAGCVSSHCDEIVKTLKNSLQVNQLTQDVLVTVTGCMGICAVGPVMLILPERTFYTNLTPEKTKEIVKAHLCEGRVLEQYTFYDQSLERYVPCIDDIEFFKAQVKIVLDNCGTIAFNDIQAYIARDGYMALANALHNRSPQEVIDELMICWFVGRVG